MGRHRFGARLLLDLALAFQPTRRKRRVAPSTICFIILAAVVALFVWNRIPIGIVAIGAALALWATGILTLNQALAGFGDPVVLFIASLFVVSEALDATGVTTWAGQQLIARVGNSQTRLLVLTMLLAAALSAVISPNGAVLPWCRWRSCWPSDSAAHPRCC